MFCTPLSDHLYYCVPFNPASAHPTPAPPTPATPVLALSDTRQPVRGNMTVQFPGLDSPITVQPTTAENKPLGFYRLSPENTSATFTVVPTLKIFDSSNQPLVTLAVPGVYPEDWTCYDGAGWPLCWATCGCSMNQKEFVQQKGEWIVRTTLRAKGEGVAPGSSGADFSCGCKTSELVASGMVVTVERRTL